MAVDFGGVKMKNPINTASGTFGQGWQFSELMDVSQLGAITTKGCAAEPWPGNPAPRMTEVRGGMMNSVGLQNPGVEAFARDYGPWLDELTGKGTQVICQVAGHSTEEYVRALEMFDELCPWAAGFEINVSCPNIAAGGAACGSTPDGAAEVMRACRKVTDRPLFVKMAPVRIPEISRRSRRRELMASPSSTPFPVWRSMCIRAAPSSPSPRVVCPVRCAIPSRCAWCGRPPMRSIFRSAASVAS